MGKVHELRIRSNRFIMDLDNVIKSIVTDNEQLLNLNREQLKDEHKNKLDEFIQPPYSRNYAIWKGFSTPNLYVTGNMFSKMKLRTTRNGYIITSLVEYTQKLTDEYGYGLDVFGIALSKQNEAYQITTPLLTDEYRKKVLTK